MGAQEAGALAARQEGTGRPRHGVEEGLPRLLFVPCGYLGHMSYLSKISKDNKKSGLTCIRSTFPALIRGVRELALAPLGGVFIYAAQRLQVQIHILKVNRREIRRSLLLICNAAPRQSSSCRNARAPLEFMRLAQREV